MVLDILDPLTMLVFVGLIIILMPFLKINGQSIEVIKGKEKYFFVIGAIACIAGVYFFLQGSVVTPIETTVTEDIATEAITSRDTTVGTESETSVETETSIITESPTETPIEVSTETAPQAVITPTPVDVSPYLDWSFTTSKDNFYIDVPDGYSYVTVTIHMENGGDIPISTDGSYWKFISNGVSYSCEPVTTAFSTPSQFEVKPGESLTFTIHYLVEGEPTTASLSYSNPYTNV